LSFEIASAVPSLALGTPRNDREIYQLSQASTCATKAFVSITISLVLVIFVVNDSIPPRLTIPARDSNSSNDPLLTMFFFSGCFLEFTNNAKSKTSTILSSGILSKTLNIDSFKEAARACIIGCQGQKLLSIHKLVDESCSKWYPKKKATRVTRRCDFASKTTENKVEGEKNENRILFTRNVGD